MSAAANIALLQRVRAACAAGQALAGDDAERLAQVLAEFFRSAVHGFGLDDAFELTPLAGGEPWYVTAARDRRDAELRKLAAEFCPGAGITAQVKEVGKLIRRYETGAWHRADQFSRTAMPPSYAHTPSAHLFNAFVAGDGKVPSSASQLRAILVTTGNESEKSFCETPQFHRAGVG